MPRRNGQTNLIMRILRSRLIRFGIGSSRAPLLACELRALVGCDKHYIHVRLRSLEADGRVVRRAHGLYEASGITDQA